MALSNLPHVDRVAIQTNLAGRLDWVERCDKARLALWATFHPSQVERAEFVARCRELDRRGVRFSVGIVGLKEHLGEAEALRRELPPHVYLWINAYKRVPDYYNAHELQQFAAVDPLFPINNQRHPSRGQACRCGHTVISVDGDGTARRCHPIAACHSPARPRSRQPPTSRASSRSRANWAYRSPRHASPPIAGPRARWRPAPSSRS